MTDLNQIITEWTYRLDSGYPKTDSDYDVLQEVLQDLTSLDKPAIHRIVQKARGNKIDEQGYHWTQASDKEAQEKGNEFIMQPLLNIGLGSELVSEVIQTYFNLPTQGKLDFDKNFRVHSVESFVNGGYLPFREFYNVLQTGAAAGMGRGEIMALLAIKDSMPGGTEKHDIVLQSGEWEVKELEKKAFRLGKSGQVFSFDLTPKIQKFYTDIIFPFAKIADPGEELIDMVDDRSKPLVKNLIHILETRFEEVADLTKIKTAGEWKTTLFDNWYEGFKELNQLFYQTKFDSDVKDTRLVVKTGNTAKAYWISDTDAENIDLKSGEEDPASISVGQEIDNVNKTIQIWFKRIEFNEFVKNPNIFIEGLNKIPPAFFKEILGLIYYHKEANDQKPYIAAPDDFIVFLASQGRYKFRLRNHTANAKYNFITDQD